MEGYGEFGCTAVTKNNKNNNNNTEVVTTAFHDGLLKQCKSYHNVMSGMINIRSIKRKDEIRSEVIKDKNVCINKLNFSITEYYFIDYKLLPVNLTWIHQVYGKMFYFARHPL